LFKWLIFPQIIPGQAGYLEGPSLKEDSFGDCWCKIFALPFPDTHQQSQITEGIGKKYAEDNIYTIVLSGKRM